MTRYGVDVPVFFAALWTAALFTAVWTVLAFHWTLLAFPWNGWLRWPLFALTGYWLFAAGTFTYATLYGKFRVWSAELDRLGLTGDERVVDLGCGRGAVLVLAARRLTGGRALGVDLWRSYEQLGNTEAAARANLEKAGVSDRVDLVTGDLRRLPLPDACAEVVVSNLAIHAIDEFEGRGAAVHEAYRVLVPGGRLRIADIRDVAQYADLLRRLGAVDVDVRPAGWRLWYGGPWNAASILSAAKPL
jgi:SAM-dependent methyltransferase